MKHMEPISSMMIGQLVHCITANLTKSNQRLMVEFNTFISPNIAYIIYLACMNQEKTVVGDEHVQQFGQIMKCMAM